MPVERRSRSARDTDLAPNQSRAAGGASLTERHSERVDDEQRRANHRRADAAWSQVTRDEAAEEGPLLGASVVGYQRSPIETAFANTKDAYNAIAHEQLGGIRDFKEDLLKPEAKSGWEILLEVAVESAIGACFGFVGKIIEQKAEHAAVKLLVERAGTATKEVEKAAEKTAARIADGLKDGSIDGLKTGIGGAFALAKGEGNGNLIDVFMRTHEHAINAAILSTQLALNTQEETLSQIDPDVAFAAIKSVEAAVLDSFADARARQREESLKQWLIFLARNHSAVVPASLPRNNPEAPEKSSGEKGIYMGRETSGEGVVIVHLDAGESAEGWSPQKLVKRGFEVRGITRELADELAGRPIGSIALPRQIDIEGPELIPRAPTPRVAIGVNETGSRWITRGDRLGTNDEGELWLANVGTPSIPAYAPRRDEYDRDDGPASPVLAAEQRSAAERRELANKGVEVLWAHLAGLEL